jgi:hypothetical protein
VFSGKWRFSLEGQTIDVGPGEMIFIRGNVVHTAEAVETLVAYDIFTPPREDWLTGGDAYLRSDAARQGGASMAREKTGMVLNGNQE